MSDTNLVSHPENLHIGPAKLALYDEVNDRLVMVGKVDGIVFEKLDPAVAIHQDVVNNKLVEVRGQATEDKYRLRGRFVELLDPNTLYLFMKNCGSVVVDDECNIVTTVEEYTVYEDRCFVLNHNNGFYGGGSLPAPAGVIGVGFGSGGTIPRGHYTIVVTGMYGTTEGAYVESADVFVDTNESLFVHITPPVSGIPSSYQVYIYDNVGETRGDAILIVSGITTTGSGGLDILYNELVDLGDYPGDQTGSFVLTDTDGVPFVAGTDYTLDETCALVCLESLADGGSICNGQRVIATYTYRENENVSMSIGPAKVNPKLVHPVILAMKDDDRNPPAAKGIEIELYKVLAESGWSLALSALSFDNGFDFTWIVLHSERTMSHGKVTTYNRHYHCYAPLNWATLTQWHQAEACAEAAS